MYIDIRSNNDYLKGHIAGAVNISYYDLFFNYDNYLNKSSIYYIYCNSGSKSKRLVSRLNQLGYNCVNVEGGYNNYLINKEII